MPSPFPGIDPYIEAQDRWHSFHPAFIVACSEALNNRLPPNYYATVEERVMLDATDPDDSGPRKVLHRFAPDASIQHVAVAPEAAPAEEKSSGVATLVPRTLAQAVISFDEPTQKLIDIRGLPTHRLVTTIELLSPTNKAAGGDRAAYLAKRIDMLRHGVNTVDLDLLLAGQRLPLLDPLPDGDYHAFVTRTLSPNECQVYSWSVRERLPTIAIPLKETDNDVALDLQAAFEHVFDRQRYSLIIRHDSPLPRGLSDTDRDWIAALVANK